MKDFLGKYTQKKELALSALLSEPTIQGAAKAAGVSDVTLWRWLKEKEFADAYRALKREVVSHAISKIQQLSSLATETLGDTMNDSTAPASVRVSAARIVLEMAVKAVEIDDLMYRVEQLENSQLDSSKGRRYGQ